MFLLQLCCMFLQEGSFLTTKPLCFVRNSLNSVLWLLPSVLGPWGAWKRGLLSPSLAAGKRHPENQQERGNPPLWELSLLCISPGSSAGLGKHPLGRALDCGAATHSHGRWEQAECPGCHPRSRDGSGSSSRP